MLWSVTPNLEYFLETTPSLTPILLTIFRDNFSKVCLIHLDFHLLLLSQPSPGYTDIDKIERIININVKKMINASKEKIVRIMAK